MNETMKTVKTVFFVFWFLVLSFAIFAQPNIEWEKRYGGARSEAVHYIQQTLDGGYIAVGYSSSKNGDVSVNNGEDDYWIVKLNEIGVKEWEKSYGGSNYDIPFSIQQTSDEGYIIAGFTRSNDGDIKENEGEHDSWVIKLDNQGDLEWEKNYGGEFNDIAFSLIETVDGGYIFAGYSVSNNRDDYWIVKLDLVGGIEWEKRYSSPIDAIAQSIQQTMDGGYIVAGFASSVNGNVWGSFTNYDPWIIKLDNQGDLEWEKTYDGSSDDRAYSIQQTMDGGYIVAGFTKLDNEDVGSNNNSTDYWIFKMNNQGDLEWEKTYGGSSNDKAYSIQQTTDGGYIVAGFTESNNGDVGSNNGVSDSWIIKLNNQGDLEWEKSFGGSGDDYANLIQQTTDGGYIIAGSSNSPGGGVEGSIGSIDFWILKLGSTLVGTEEVNSNSEFTVSPNPSNGDFIIRLNKLNGPYNAKIFDSFGYQVYSKDEIYGALNIENIRKGHYYIEVTANGLSFAKKIIVQ